MKAQDEICITFHNKIDPIILKWGNIVDIDIKISPSIKRIQSTSYDLTIDDVELFRKFSQIGYYVDYVLNIDKLCLPNSIKLINNAIKFMNFEISFCPPELLIIVFNALPNELEHLQIITLSSETRIFEMYQLISNIPPSLKTLNIIFQSYYGEHFISLEKQQEIKETIKLPYGCVLNIFNEIYK